MSSFIRQGRASEPSLKTVVYIYRKHTFYQTKWNITFLECPISFCFKRKNRCLLLFLLLSSSFMLTLRWRRQQWVWRILVKRLKRKSVESIQRRNHTVLAILSSCVILICVKYIFICSCYFTYVYVHKIWKCKGRF